MTGVRVLPGGLPVPRRPPPHAGTALRERAPAQAGVERSQRSFEGDDRRGSAAAEGESKNANEIMKR